VLRLQNADGSTGRPLVVVPNPSLLDNHQEELASALGALGYLIASTVAYVPSSCFTIHMLSLTLRSNIPCNRGVFFMMLWYDTGYSTLPETLLALDKSRLIPFPPFDGSRFRDLLDEEMGF
jgi:beta-1,4-N-acetylglucosaminyltransferase